MHGKNKIENMDPFTLGTAVPQVKKGGRKTGLRRTGIPATCEARTDYREEREREGLHMPTYDDEDDDEHTRASAFI